MGPDGFRRIVLPEPGPQAPCLLRGVFYQHAWQLVVGQGNWEQ